MVVQEQVRVLPRVGHIHRRVELHSGQGRKLRSQQGGLSHLARSRHDNHREAVEEAAQFRSQEPWSVVNTRYLVITSLLFNQICS